MTLLNAFQACGVSLPPLSPEKTHVTHRSRSWNGDELSRGVLAQAWGQAPAVAKRFLLVWGLNEARHLRPLICTERDSKNFPGRTCSCHWLIGFLEGGREEHFWRCWTWRALCTFLWDFTFTLHSNYNSASGAGGKWLRVRIQLTEVNPDGNIWDWRTRELSLLPSNYQPHSVTRGGGGFQFRGDCMR